MQRRLLFGWLAALVWSAIAATNGQAQDSVVVIRPDQTDDTLSQGKLPVEIIRRIISIYNDSTTTRIAGSFTLPAGAHLEGRVAVYRGTLRVYGRIDGAVTVINGDVVVGSGGLIKGPVLVVGGRAEVRKGGVLDGDQTAFDPLAPVVRMPNGLLAFRERRKALGDLAAARTSFQTGSINTTLSLETGRTFNRVEGLPIVFGPSFATQGPGTVDAVLNARAIFRPTTDRTKLRGAIGFVIGTEWHGGGKRRWFTFGGKAYRQILPFEDQPLSKGEAGWSAFLLQRDYRDHYEARGAEGFVTVEPLRRLRLGLSYREDLERSVPTSDPVSVLRNQDAWRPNPLIDDGHYRTARVSLDYDTRHDPIRPSAGWLIHADAERSRSDDVSPVSLPTAIRAAIPASNYHFSKVRFDIRRYARINPAARVNVRFTGAGWLSGDPLPLQRRVSLGGPDILPGYGFRALNCAPSGFVDPAEASLCDRTLSAQIEVRTRLPIGIPFRVHNADLAALQQIFGIEQADLVLMGNAGKAWLSGEGPGRVPNDRIPKLNEWDADIGVGLDTGGLGLYVAKSLAASRPLRLILRLQRRF